MYSIGEVERITGISKDRLRNYEKNGILKPKKDDGNMYRSYSEVDIVEVLSVEYYRSMDLGVKAIKQIRQQGNLEYLKQNLLEKEKEVISKLEELTRIHAYVEEAVRGCRLIEEHLNQYCIRKMPQFNVLGTMSDSLAFSEYAAFQNRANKNLPIIRSMVRKITFDDQGVIENEMQIVERRDAEESDLSGELCLYTIVEEKVDGLDVMSQIFTRALEWAEQNGYSFKGRAYAGVLMFTYPQGNATSYLEIFAPVEKK